MQCKGNCLVMKKSCDKATCPVYIKHQVIVEAAKSFDSNRYYVSLEERLEEDVRVCKA